MRNKDFLLSVFILLILPQFYAPFVFSQGSSAFEGLRLPPSSEVIIPEFPGGSFRTPFPPPVPIDPVRNPVLSFQNIIKNFYEPKSTATWSPEQVREFVIISARNFGLPIEEKFIGEALVDLLEKESLSGWTRTTINGKEVIISEYKNLGFKTYSEYFPIEGTMGSEAKVVAKEITNQQLYSAYKRRVGNIAHYAQEVVE